MVEVIKHVVLLNGQDEDERTSQQILPMWCLLSPLVRILSFDFRFLERSYFILQNPINFERIECTKKQSVVRPVLLQRCLCSVPWIPCVSHSCFDFSLFCCDQGDESWSCSARCELYWSIYCWAVCTWSLMPHNFLGFDDFMKISLEKVYNGTPRLECYCLY